MKKRYSILLMVLLCLLNNVASTQLPQVNFPNNKFVCDFNPWKLVLFDDFNGTSLNNTKWFPFNTNNWDNHDNWCEARLGYPGNHSIHRDENVIVNGGTLKLTVEQKTNTWQCASCNTAGCTNAYWGGAPRTENYTSGYISSKLRFNNGKVETRVKMPNHENSWGTIWFWMGTKVNEIDIAEAWGGKYGAIAANNRPRNTYSTHAWWFDAANNPYNLPQDMHIPNRYPNQSWWQWLMGSKKYLRQEEWHDYAMEWDTSVVKFYFDNELEKEIWKYYRNKLVAYWDGTNWVWHEVREPSTCLMPAGDWKITEGFPYIKDSECKLIFSVGQTSRDKIRSTDGHVGQMEVDYVKVYQRHPENEGHTAICTSPIPQIVGPNTMCGGTGYTLSTPTPGGSWTINNNAVTFGGGTGGSSVLLDRNPYSNEPTTILSYTYTPGEGCPPVKISKVINTGLIYANVGVIRTWTPFWQRFNLFVDPGISGATYLWKVWYGSMGPTNYYEGSGPFITTPKVPTSIFLAPYYLKWEVTIITSCGPTVVTGLRSNLPFATPMLAKTNTYLMPDSSAMFLEAKFDSESDIQKYQNAVNFRVSKEFVADLNDTASIAKMIGQIELEELEPYLYFEDKDEITMVAKKLIGNSNKASTIYPNPTSKSLVVTLSELFDPKNHTSYNISDLTGKNLYSGLLIDEIDVSILSPGMYILELRQGEIRENIKFVKE